MLKDDSGMAHGLFALLLNAPSLVFGSLEDIVTMP